MKPLSTYIEYLLMTRHYAFVPGLGGFMFQAEEARVMLGGRLMPPLRLLKFNRFMDHDDGMLANVMMKVEGLSFDEANRSIRLSISDLLSRVQHEGRYALGRLGYVYFDEDCHIAFRPADQVFQDSVYYGMGQVNVRSWKEVEKERNRNLQKDKTEPAKASTLKRHDGVIELPTKWLRWAAIVLLVVTFFFSNMLPWSTSSDEHNYANLVDTGNLLRQTSNALEPQSWDESWEQTNPDSILMSAEAACEQASALENDTLVPLTNTVREAEPSNVAPTPDVQNTQVPSVVSRKGKQYIVIVGSCESQAEADRLIRRLGKKGYNDLKVYECDGRYRVYINQFAQKEDAVSYMNNLRETSPFGDAWILGVRSSEISSLSYIIKNKDNDQLPMELSHLNRTAERDQG